MDNELKHSFNYRRYIIKTISYLLVRYFISNIILNLLLACYTIFDICTNKALFNTQFRKTSY